MPYQDFDRLQAALEKERKKKIKKVIGQGFSGQQAVLASNKGFASVSRKRKIRIKDSTRFRKNAKSGK